MKPQIKTNSLALVLGIFTTLLICPDVRAVQIQDIVRLKGAQTNKLVGMGLVVGLKGTGDGGKFMPAIRPLAELIKAKMDANTVASELKNAKNVALVALSATLPISGVREGDLVDVHISAVGAAKSLAGGRLFLVPLTGPLPTSPVYAYAEGLVIIDDDEHATNGIIRKGAQLVQDVMTRHFDDMGRITLVINEESATWPVAHNLANQINGVISPDGKKLAKVIDQKNISIDVPMDQRSDPAGFISQILTAYIDLAFIAVEARVVINQKAGTIVIGGDVEISPVIISHPGLTITTITPPTEPTQESPLVMQKEFVGIAPGKRGARLADLEAAFNQLKIGPTDRVTIIKELHRSGKLHAQVIYE